MLQCDQIPHLKVYRMKTYLPYIDRTPLKNSVIIYNGTDPKNINNILKKTGYIRLVYSVFLGINENIAHI